MPIRSGQSKRQNNQIGEGKKLRKESVKIKMYAAHIKQFCRFFSFFFSGGGDEDFFFVFALFFCCPTVLHFHLLFFFK